MGDELERKTAAQRPFSVRLLMPTTVSLRIRGGPAAGEGDLTEQGRNNQKHRDQLTPLTRVHVMEVAQVDPQAVKAKETERLGSLYASEAEAVIRLAYVLTGDRHAAEDIAHDAFARVGRRLFGLRDPEHSRAYLYRTVVNLCRGRGRRLRIERRALQKLDKGDPHEGPNIAAQDEMWTAILRLPLRQRAALFLRYYQDLSEAQAADVMQCSLSAMKSLVNRGLKELRAGLEGVSDD
jgi:RNA polymerase sigma factor (sigma-70 family)